MTREEALSEVKFHVKDKNLMGHILATEAIMKGLAARLGQDVQQWGMAGLLHDIDYEEVGQDAARHGLEGARWLKEMGVDDEIIHAVMAHNEYHGIERASLLDKALYAADPLSGLITAVSLVLPSKSISDVTVKQVKKKFKDKAFARGANREQIASCGELGLELDEFIQIALSAMQAQPE